MNTKTTPYQVLFCNEENGKNLVIRLVPQGFEKDKKLNKKVNSIRPWKNQGWHNLNAKEFQGRRAQVLADTNATFKTSFKKVQVEIIKP
jgi:hypothetical protein